MAELSPRAKMLSVIPHVTGGLSIFGSSTIILSVSLHPRRRAESTYHRLMMCMSCCDIISSFAYFVSTWALPQGINEGWGDPYFFAAVGNEATCTAQGVAIQFGVVTALYNLALAVHYLLIVRWRISKQILRAKYDSFLRWTPPIVALGLTIPGIFLKAYANCNLWCWLATNWSQCPGDPAECVRKGNVYRFIFYYGPLWASILFIIVTQSYIWKSIREIEKKTKAIVESKSGQTKDITEAAEESPAENRLSKSISKLSSECSGMATCFCILIHNSSIRRWFSQSRGEEKESSYQEDEIISNASKVDGRSCKIQSNTLSVLYENEEELTGETSSREEPNEATDSAVGSALKQEPKEVVRQLAEETIKTTDMGSADGSQSIKPGSQNTEFLKKRTQFHLHSKRIAFQSFLYVSVFFITWLPYTITSLTFNIWFKPSNNGFWMLLTIVICQPLQGFLNSLIFHLRFLKKIYRNPRKECVKCRTRCVNLWCFRHYCGPNFIGERAETDRPRSFLREPDSRLWIPQRNRGDDSSIYGDDYFDLENSGTGKCNNNAFREKCTSHPLSALQEIAHTAP